jgi:long-subunit acyl-CoA synthetase (AMP-forming)
MGYSTKDKPFPRGEVLVKTKTMFGGYFKDPSQTSEALQDGWYHTGDIGVNEGGRWVFFLFFLRCISSD